MGNEADGAELLRPLRELGAEIDTFAMMPPVGISELHMDPPNPVPYAGAHLLLGDLPPEAIDELVAAIGPGSGSPLVSDELRHIGGALARAATGHGAIASLPGEYMTFGVGMVFGEAVAARGPATLLAMSRRCSSPHDTGRKYLNFAEQATDPPVFYAPETWARLRAVKAEVDPAELFRANHPIGPAS